MRWLRLEQKNPLQRSDNFVKIHTHFGMNAHLHEQGYTLAFYHSDIQRPDASPEVMYIKTDHDGFFSSCCEKYSDNFIITELSENFRVGRKYRLSCGSDHSKTMKAAVA